MKKNSIIEICPIRNVVSRFGNKWALLLILILDENGIPYILSAAEALQRLNESEGAVEKA